MKRQENRAMLAWRGAVSTGLVSTADWAYMQAPVPRPTLRLVDKVELLTKSLVRGARRENRKKKDAYRRHPIHLIILFKFKAVAERRQWSSAASNPRRKTRVKLCPHF